MVVCVNDVADLKAYQKSPMTLAVIDEHKDYILLQQINLQIYIFDIINMLHR